MKIQKETMGLAEELLNRDYDIEICHFDGEFLVVVQNDDKTEVFTECEFIHHFSIDK